MEMKLYVSPIKVIYDRIVREFASNSTEMTVRLDNLVSEGLLDTGIFISPSISPALTPKANFDTKQVELHEGYITFLWCIAYSMISIKETFDTKIGEGKPIVTLSPETPGLDEMNKVFGWGLSLRDKYTMWPIEIPNPSDDTERVKWTNELVAYAMAYQMFHELAHLANKHGGYADLVSSIQKGYEPTDDELISLKQVEAEADNYAADCLFLSEDTDDIRYMKLLGAVIAQISNFFLIDSSSKLTQARHPDIDSRLFNLVNKITIENELHKAFVDLTCNMGLSLYLHVNKIHYLPTEQEAVEMESFDDVLTLLYGTIDKEKAKWASYKQKGTQ